ncbi:DUF2183 domain-containing protein [Desulfococcaceae bacterium OttesenSCG-928-F15]|nr:DUF2183 domain-containing protein [Desulfococcaceae bacterium OttesenSCG-928-F15]
MKESVWKGLFAGVFLFFLPASLWASQLKSDEDVLFFPDLAWERPDGRMEVQVEAWVFEEEKRPGMASALASYLDVDLGNLSPEENKIFSERARLFKTDSERWKRLEIIFDGNSRSFPLSSTNRAGRSSSRILPDQKAPESEKILSFHLKPPKEISYQAEGFVLFIPKKGISVISDLDDTVKVTEVLDKKKMLHNTFFKEFLAVPGMAELYRNLAREKVSFHYLSSSPIQLYPALHDFLVKEAFPEGSMHLRESTSWKTMIPGKKDSRKHKEGTILRLLHTFPERHFILIGDSGEADPEIYAEIARKYPEKILAIGIRDVTGEDQKSKRYEKTFSGIPEDRWLIFREAPKWQDFLKKN